MYDTTIDSHLDACRELLTRETFMVNLCAQAPTPYAYTIGLTAVLGYELVCVGQEERASSIILNETAMRLLEQSTLPDATRITSDRCTDVKLAPLYIDRARGELFHVLPKLGFHPPLLRHVIVSTSTGRFPGDAGYDGPLQDIDACIERDRTSLH